MFGKQGNVNHAVRVMVELGKILVEKGNKVRNRTTISLRDVTEELKNLLLSIASYNANLEPILRVFELCLIFQNHFINVEGSHRAI